MLKIMGEHIKNIGALTQSDIQHLKAMRRTGADMRKIKKILAEMTAKNVSDIEKIFDTLARNGYTDAKTAYELKHEPFIPFSENTALQSFINSVSRQAIADYMNLSRTTAAKMLKADGTVVNMPFDKAYDSIIDEAVHNITTGAQNPQKAMRNALKTFAEGGIRTVEYESGHTRRLDSAVRANILEGMRKVNQGVQDILGEQLGTDIVEISVHQFPAPDHEDIQGKQMSNEEYAKWDKAHEYPLRQIGKLNCRHVVFHKFSGQSPEYTPEQLEEIKRRNHAKITFMEKEYTVYEATQLQRKIETETRKQKHVQVLARSCGDRELAETAQRKINELAKRYKELSEKSGLSVQKDRMSVSGYRKIKAETTDINYSNDEIQYNKYKEVLGETNLPKNLDSFRDLKYNKTDEWNNLKKSYRTVKEFDEKLWTDEFKAKAKQLYFEFKKDGIEFSSHAVSRFLSRQENTNGIVYTYADIVKQCKLPANYKQADERQVKYYNNIAIIYNAKNDTVVSLVNRKNPKKDWRNI